jgi:hypothetical protein
MAVAEKQLQKEFGDELKKLSISQGRILIKLIDRNYCNLLEISSYFRSLSTDFD